LTAGPIGDGSCIDAEMGTCAEANSSIGSESCLGFWACQYALGESIGSKSCQGYGACYATQWSVGDGSCNGEVACLFRNSGIGNNACNGAMACFCGEYECAELTTAPVGEGSCNGDYACSQAQVSIGNNACNGDFACNCPDPKGTGLEVGDGECNVGPDGNITCCIPVVDGDGDGVNDDDDNCPTISNANQTDSDGDTIGDACEPDGDGDGIIDDDDNCPTISNADQTDSDGDTIGNACEPDVDGDGIIDDVDNCPTISNADQADSDGDKIGDACDTDVDGDGIGNTADNCPRVANADQIDTNHNGRGDACDITVMNNGPYLYAVSQLPLNLITFGGCPSEDTECIRSTCAGPASDMQMSWTSQGVNTGVLQTSPGIYVASLSCTGTVDGQILSDSASMYLVVYDPTQGHVTGGGWLNSPLGAYAMDATLTGKANFAFNAKYQRGANVPSGTTEFKFDAGNFQFQSTSYEWLVVSGMNKAKFKGKGNMSGPLFNGSEVFQFMVTVKDNGEGKLAVARDTFRIKIWRQADATVIYDNQMGAGDEDYVGTAIGGGNIIVRTS